MGRRKVLTAVYPPIVGDDNNIKNFIHSSVEILLCHHSESRVTSSMSFTKVTVLIKSKRERYVVLACREVQLQNFKTQDITACKQALLKERWRVGAGVRIEGEELPPSTLYPGELPRRQKSIFGVPT